MKNPVRLEAEQKQTLPNDGFEPPTFRVIDRCPRPTELRWLLLLMEEEVVLVSITDGEGN